MFYFWSIVLLLAAALLVLLALRGQRKSPSAEEDGDATVAALYRDRLRELRAELEGGMVPEAERAVIEAELKASLLADVDNLSTADPDPTGMPMAENSSGRNAGLLLGGVSAALLLVFSLLVYNQVGDPLAMSLANAEAVFELDPSADKDTLLAWRETLENRVDGRPDDGKSWYLLGHVDLRLGRFATAAEAFSMARESHGNDPGIDIFWLQARYMDARGQIDETSRTIAERILANDPNQPLVMEMFAIDAFQRGAYQESVGLLNRALTNPLQTDHRQTLEAGFAEARSRLGVLPGAVDVAISAEADVPTHMTLFVIARPVGGGMPYAVVRRPFTSLPRTVRLDDAVSMNPALPLSTAAEVEVVVRLSRSGAAMAHPGDWEWQSEPLTLPQAAEAAQLAAVLKPPA